MGEDGHVGHHTRPRGSFVAADPFENPQQQADAEGGGAGNDLVLGQRLGIDAAADRLAGRGGLFP